MKDGFIDDVKPELNCGIVIPILDSFGAIYGAGAYAEFVGKLGIPEAYLRNNHNWISYEAYNRILEILVKETGDPDSVFKVVRGGVNGFSMGPLKVVVMPVLSIANFYRLAVLGQRSYSKLADWEIHVLEPGHALLGLRYHKQYKQTHNNCDAVRGFLAGLPQWAGQPPAEVNHLKCEADGADCCLYDVVWREPGKQTLAMIVGWSLIAIAVGVGVEYWVDWETGTRMFGATIGFLCFVLGMFREARKAIIIVQEQNKLEAEELNRALQSIRQLNEDLQHMVELRTSELAKTNKSLEEAMVQLKESRAKELQAERQAAIGVLAAGMAHEMNNPLHAVSVSAQGLKVDLGSDPDLGPFVATIERAAQRCRRIIGEILSFSRESKTEMADLPEIVRVAVSTFSNEYPPSLSLELQIAPDLPRILLDAAQIRQAVNNLLMNAADAMDKKGLIQISIGLKDARVTIAVKDSGPGMPESVKKRVFDPFFTTKQKGGLGLGLSITWQLVEKNGGTMEVESQEGAGAIFRIILPVSRGTL